MSPIDPTDVRQSPAGIRPRSGGFDVLRRVRGRTRSLWLLVIAVALADTVLTAYGLRQGFAEANPLARSAIHAFGIASLVALKLLALGVAYATWRLLSNRLDVLVPIALALVWSAAVCVNAVVLWTGP